MRIGMILDKEFPPDPRVENEALALVSKGFEVYLFCLHYKSNIQFETYKGIKICRYPFNAFLYKSSALAYTVPVYSFFMSKKIKNFLRKQEITHIHIHDIRIAQAAEWANDTELPCVLDLHDNFPEIMKFYPHLQKFPGRYIINPENWKRQEAKFISNADRVVSVSPQFKNQLIDRFPLFSEKMVLVPNTISREFYTDIKIDQNIRTRFKSKFVLLYLGDTGLRRGLLTVIRAMPEILKEIPNAQLVIVGSNSSDPVLKEEALKLKVINSISFEGWQNQEVFPSYIEMSSVCLSPLDRNAQHDVAYANKLFQYMGFKKPLLVSDAIAQRDLVNQIDCGEIHKEKDPEDFAKKVVQMHGDWDRLKILGENGFKFVDENFCWEESQKSLIDMYRTL
jgi:glycosyltransferase involved in cell wall biosynthesis